MYGKNKSIAFILFFLVSLIATLFLFGSSFHSYFFQDDWYSLQISRVQSAQDFLHFFFPLHGLVYYRPLGMQVPFFIFQTIFGLTPLPFRASTFVVHIINCFLLYCFCYQLCRSRKASLISMTLYATSAVHATTFYWAATIAFALAPLWYFSSVILYQQGKYKASFICFFLGLLTNEFLITLPIVLVIVTLYEKKKIILPQIIPFFSVSALYGFMRVALFPLPHEASYGITFSLKQILITLRNYFLWSLNWPETAGEQFAHFFVLNKHFIDDFPHLILPMYTIVIAFSAVTFSFFWLQIKRRQCGDFIRTAIFSITWFVSTLLPVLFFSQHAFTYYLPIPLFGVLIFLGKGAMVLIQKYQKWAYASFFCFLVLWLYMSFLTMDVYRLTHWAPRRAEIAQKTLQELKLHNPNPHDNDVFHVPRGDEYHWALSDQNGVRVFFNNPTLKTIYDK